MKTGRNSLVVYQPNRITIIIAAPQVTAGVPSVAFSTADAALSDAGCGLLKQYNYFTGTTAFSRLLPRLKLL